jgi:integrase
MWASARKSLLYLHTAVVVALHTGMRKGEIQGLRWENVNWERKTLLLLDTKNGESRRLPIDSILLRELSEHRSRVKNEDLVFPSFDNNGTMADVKGSFGRVLKDAGITNFRFHDLRHIRKALHDERRPTLRAFEHPPPQGSEDDATLRQAHAGVHGFAARSNGHYLDTGATSLARCHERNTNQVRAVTRVEMVDVRGLEPLTSSLRTRRSPN